MQATIRLRTRDAIQGHELFEDLTAEQRAYLASLTTPWQVDAGELIMRQGEPADRLLVTTEGSVLVTARAGGGHERELARLPAGTVLGEMALLTSGRRTATVRALDPCRGVAMTRETFELLRVRQDPAALALVEGVGRTAMRRLRNRYAGLAANLGVADGYAPPIRARAARPAGLLEVAPDEYSDDTYLSTLLFFRRFTRAEITSTRQAGRTSQAGRGCRLVVDGSLWIVLRGAVEVSIVNGCRQRVRLAGPGRCIGLLVVAEEDGPCPTLEHRARERCVLLELPRERARALLAGHGIASRRFAEAFHEDVARALLSAEAAHAPLPRTDLDRGPLLAPPA